MDFSGIFQKIGEEFIGPVIAGAIIFAILKVKEIKKKLHTNEAVQITSEKNDKIQDLLLEIRIRLGADRSYLTMIHNGDKYIEGSEIFKMSRSHESAGGGISLEAYNYQSILTSLVNDEMKLVSSEGPSFTLVSALPDGKFRRMCETRSIKAVARCAIRKNGYIIGFVGLDYNYEISPPVNIDDLCRYAGILEQVLSDYRPKT